MDLSLDGPGRRCLHRTGSRSKSRSYFHRARDLFPFTLGAREPVPVISFFYVPVTQTNVKLLNDEERWTSFKCSKADILRMRARALYMRPPPRTVDILASPVAVAKDEGLEISNL